jgi:hypothetical protein
MLSNTSVFDCLYCDNWANVSYFMMRAGSAPWLCPRSRPWLCLYSLDAPIAYSGPRPCSPQQKAFVNSTHFRRELVSIGKLSIGENRNCFRSERIQNVTASCEKFSSHDKHYQRHLTLKSIVLWKKHRSIPRSSYCFSS